jgi:hypothetical protein
MGVRGRGDDDPVAAQAVREGVDAALDTGVTPNEPQIHGILLGGFDHGRVDVDADHPDARGPKQQGRELPDEAKADDGAGFAEPEIRLADTLEGDSPKGVVGRLFEIGCGG